MSTGNFLQKLDFINKGLEDWAGKILKNKKGKKIYLTAKLSELLEAARDDSNMAELIDTNILLNSEIEKDERYWEQRAKLNWLKLRDKNTTFFHSQATQRRKKNMIKSLQSEHGRATENLQEMEKNARSYFQSLFSLENQGNCDFLLSGINHCINDEDNKRLTAHYTREEIREALFEMGPTKAPSEDGLPAIFYQKRWHFIGEDTVSFRLLLLNGEM